MTDPDEGPLTGKLPDFEVPPVIEVVCGVQFNPMEFPVAAVGRFWDRIRESYPHAKDQPPIVPRFERFDPTAEARGSSVTIDVGQSMMPRTFFDDDTETWLLQLQRDRFLHNWRKGSEDREYPRFPAVFSRFSDAWDGWLDFCRGELEAEPAVNQYELTYVNHIPAGDGWETLADTGRIFRDLTWAENHDFLPAPEGLQWHSQFRMPNTSGRLHVKIHKGVRRSDDKPILMCELTARGIDPEKSMSEWFELGREWIVRGFADLTTDFAHDELWRRR